VTCPACGVENAPTRKFCRACGARLPLCCPACEAANEPDDRFCGECGTLLTASAPPTPTVATGGQPHPSAPQPAARPAPSEERRQVTVLFADLVGFTALSERLDPEEVRDITTDCLRQLAAEAVRFEGTVDKLIGDAVMIVFGAPVAHEDDPARALRSALAMQRALTRFNEQLERTHGLALRLRIGVETGEVVAGPREVGGMVEYTVIGDAVNVAARLQTAAEPGSILLGEATRARVGRAFALQDIAPLALKGRERSVGAAILLGEAPDASADELRVPLVGRASELRTLQERLRALLTGHGGAAVVVSGPGLGKTRLLSELRTSQQDERLRWVRCQAYAHEQTQSYGLARSLVRALLGIGADDRDEASAAQLHAGLAAFDLVAEEATLARLLGFPVLDAVTASAPVVARAGSHPSDDPESLDTLSPRDLQRRFFDAMLTLAARLAERQPLVLELDDLHWADPTSIDLLLELLDLATRAQILLLCAFRPEPDAACQHLREHAQWRLGDAYAEIALRPLSEAASAELAAHLLGQNGAEDASDSVDGRALPPAVRTLLERAAGTPLWLEELVRTLVDRGILAAQDGRWQLPGDIATIELPDSLQALIVARIDRLGPARPTLQVASVIGRRFGRTVLERVAETTARLDADLTQAQRADLVRELPAHLDREYDFKHVLVRDAAYATLLHRRRRALHRRVAEAVEQLYPERVPELHAILAYHYERAELWPRAYEHARAAAEAARDSYANREALESYTLALQMAERAGRGAAERGALYEGRGAIHERLGQFEAAQSDFEAALALAEQQTDQEGTATRIRLLGALGMLWGGHKDYVRGVELTGQAVALAQASGDARAQADASVQLGILLLNLLRLAEGREVLETALGLYRQLDDPLGQARTLDALGLFCCCAGRLADGARHLLDAHERMAMLGDRGGAASTAAMSAMALGFAGRRLEAERQIQRALGLADEIGAPSAASFSWMILAETLDQYGAYTRADEAAQRALKIAQEIGHREWTLAALGPIGRVRRAHGDLAGGLAAHQEMLSIAGEVGSALWTVEALANVALDQLLLGNLDAAEAASAEAMQRGGQYQKGNLNAWLTRGLLALRNGRPADALATAREIRELASEFLVRLPEAWRLEGDALAALGEAEAAEEAYRDGMTAARGVDAAAGLWQAGRGQLALLRQTGRHAEATTLEASLRAELGALAVTLREPELARTLTGYA
jgi:class 3 adenylate cyclase